LMQNASAPALRNSSSLSLALRPQIRDDTPRDRSAWTVSVPRSWYMTVSGVTKDQGEEETRV
jgi:hypothetical protein